MTFALLPASAGASKLPTYESQKSIPFSYRKIKKGETLRGLFPEDWETVARFNRIDERHVFPGLEIKVPDDLEAAKNYTPMPETLENAAAEEKYALVDLSEQFLGAYEHGRLKFSLPISSAKTDCLGPHKEKRKCRTPTGKFKVLAFHRDHFSSLYKNPSTGKPVAMPHAVMFYVSKTKKGGVAYWLHGGDLPGYPASHGCIRLYPEDAKKLFEWLGGDVNKSELARINNGITMEVVKIPD